MEAEILRVVIVSVVVAAGVRVMLDKFYASIVTLGLFSVLLDPSLSVKVI